MEAYNLLRYHADRFSTSVEALEEHLAFKGTHTVLARNNMYFLLKHGLEQYISDSRMPLPELPGAVFTRLDYNLREMRREKRHQAEDAAKYLLSHPADEETDVDAPLAEVNRGGLLEMGVDAITEDLLVEMQSLLRRMTGAVARLLAQRSLPTSLVLLTTLAFVMCARTRSHGELAIVSLIYVTTHRNRRQSTSAITHACHPKHSQCCALVRLECVFYNAYIHFFHLFFFFSYRLCLLIPDLVYDPQMSVPDVIVWILTSGTRRAFIRILAVDLIYHPQVRAKHP